VVTVVHVLGIGSPFGEDQAGFRLVERLREEGFRSPISGISLVFETLDRPGWGLLEIIKQADRAILVDAMRSGREPGTLARLGAGDLIGESGPLTTHDVGVRTTLALGQTLGLIPRGLVVFGIEIGPVSASPSLREFRPSEAMVRAFKKALEEELAGDWLKRT
jgi:hydrogenase maturation protease